MTSGSAGRGIANSDSRNRTRRGETNTSWEWSTNSRADSTEPEMLLSRGTSERRRAAISLSSPNTPLLRSSSSTRCRMRPTGARLVPSGTRLLRLTSAFSVCGNQ